MGADYFFWKATEYDKLLDTLRNLSGMDTKALQD